MIRQERAFGPYRVYDLRFGQFVGPGFALRHDADLHLLSLLELFRLTPAADTWTDADEQEIRRMCS